MEDSHLLIIGAGASGLMAARILAQAGLNVTILEGRDRTGGRIHTLDDPLFSFPAEAGAEFIHGKLSVTMKVLKEAGIAYSAAAGKVWNSRQGKLSPGQAFTEGWPELMKKLEALQEDLSVEDFLHRHFADEKYLDLRRSLVAFVEGYDAADPRRASTFALRDEWMNDDDHEQYRVEGGYGRMISYLEKECLEAGVKIRLNTNVREIYWAKNQVELKAGERSFRGTKLLLTVPLGVLRSGAILFHPQIPEKMEAVSKMGFGAVIKILLCFRDKFWERLRDDEGNNLKDLSFLFSAELVPTWWTQHPQDVPLLTGWLAGPKAEHFKTSAEEELLDLALSSLASILHTGKGNITAMLKTYRIINWTSDPFTMGAYGYATVGSSEARKILAAPLSGTLFFAGEALYDGPEMGTVEAALASGEKTAAEILESWKS